MSDTLHSTPPLANDPAARTPTGEIKPAAALATTESTTKTPEATPTEPKVETKVEPKPGDTILGEKPKDEKKAVEAKGPPEKYEITAPSDWKDKGYELDTAVIERATPIFKELGLSNDAAQKLVNFYAAESAKDHESSMNLVLEQNEKWKAEVKADPEIGGKLDQVKVSVSRMLDNLGDPALATAFKTAMDTTGMGNHPAFVRALYKLSQKFSEGTNVSGRGPVEVRNPTGAPPSAAKAMYPNLP